MTQFDPVNDVSSTGGDDASRNNVASPLDSRRRPPQHQLHHGFAPYLLIYAQRLLEAGLPKQALRYCVELSKVESRGSGGASFQASVKSLATKLLLEDRSFYAGFVLQKKSFSQAFQSWLNDVRVDWEFFFCFFFLNRSKCTLDFFWKLRKSSCSTRSHFGA